jgi:ABC-type molybdenum transport system ATPase subunit/photorepair protein PhrA
MNSVEFNRIEDCIHTPKSSYDAREVVVSFDTRQTGIYQLSYTSDGYREVKNEPNLMMFTKAEQQYMKEMSALCWKIVFDGKKPDFDSIQ